MPVLEEEEKKREKHLLEAGCLSTSTPSFLLASPPLLVLSVSPTVTHAYIYIIYVLNCYCDSTFGGFRVRRVARRKGREQEVEETEGGKQKKERSNDADSVVSVADRILDLSLVASPLALFLSRRPYLWLLFLSSGRFFSLSP